MRRVSSYIGSLIFMSILCVARSRSLQASADSPARPRREIGWWRCALRREGSAWQPPHRARVLAFLDV